MDVEAHIEDLHGESDVDGQIAYGGKDAAMTDGQILVEEDGRMVLCPCGLCGKTHEVALLVFISP